MNEPTNQNDTGTKTYGLYCPRCRNAIHVPEGAIGTVVKCRCNSEYQVVLTLQRMHGNTDRTVSRLTELAVTAGRHIRYFIGAYVQPWLSSRYRYTRDQFIPWLCKCLVGGFHTTQTWLREAFKERPEQTTPESRSNTEAASTGPSLSSPNVQDPQPRLELTSTVTPFTEQVVSQEPPFPGPSSATHIGDSTSDPSYRTRPSGELLDNAVNRQGTSRSAEVKNVDILLRLSRQMLAAEMYSQAYTHAAEAVVLDINNAEA